MKRILLIQAYNGRKERTGTIFPLGLCYIATPLLEKHIVCIFDPNLSEAPYEELKGKIQEFEPDLVGLSIRNIDTLDKRDIFYYFKTVSPTIRIIKEIAPGVKVMAGGPGFSMFAQDIMKRIPEIDYGVYLEGEETVPELAEKLDDPKDVSGIFYRENENVIFTGPRPLPDFDSLPSPRRDLLDVKRYPFPLDNVGIQTKRGCPLRCAYCSYPFLNGNRVRLRSPCNVVNEIESLVNEFGVRQFMFVDGVFNVPISHSEAICEEIIRRGLDVEWKAWCEINGFSEKFLSLAKKAGCKSLPFSPDAASNKTLHSLGKGITVKEINKAVQIVRKHKDIRASFGFFCTPPSQTFTGLFQTIYMYLKINVLLFGRGGSSLGWIRIEPHTKIQQIAIEEGLIAQDTDLLPDKEEELNKLYYTAPSMRLGDRLVELILWLINRILKPGLRFTGHSLKRWTKRT